MSHKNFHLMCTSQKYEGKGDSAQNSSPTVKVDRILAEPRYQWQADFLRRVATDSSQLNDLFTIIERVRQIHETTDPTEGICMLLGEFIKRSPERAERHAVALEAVTKLIANLNALNSDFFCFNNDTDYVEQEDRADFYQAPADSETATSSQPTPKADEQRKHFMWQLDQNKDGLENEQDRLLNVADELTMFIDEDPVPIITHLLEHWLVTQNHNFSEERERAILSGALKAVKRITDIERCVQSIHYFRNEIAEAEKEVRGE